MSLGKKILIVDDEIDLAMTLGKFLSTEGFVARWIGEGEILAAEIASFMPDLILIDYMMPGFNGVEALERVHLNQLLQDVPIVLMSASKEPPSTKKLWTYFLKKPFDIEELLDLLNHFLKKSNIKLANSG